MKTAHITGMLKAVALVALFCASSAAQSARAGEISVYVKSGWFTWDEKLNGTPFVKEKGVMSGAGITRKDILKGVSLAGMAEVWGGNINYDGHDITGQNKIESDTSYLGTKEETSVGVKLRVGDALSFEPFVGAGHRFWIRTRSGEDWNSIYTKAGLESDLQAGGCTWYLKGGALLPVYTRSHVSLSSAGYDDVVTYPKAKLSGFAEGGVKLGAFAISVEYEGMRFGESDKVSTSRRSTTPGAIIQNSQAFQPESSSNLYSLKVAYSF
jgi:hypothetical protein